MPQKTPFPRLTSMIGKAANHFAIVLLVPVFIIMMMNINGCSQEPLHIHIISGSRQYESEPSLRQFKKVIVEHFAGARVTASWGEDSGDDLPNLKELADADLMFVFTRRMRLPEDQLSLIKQHIENEKPVIGIRTASHAFQDFLEMDSLVFGGDYSGHGRPESVRISFADDAGSHPVMAGVALWEHTGMIYHNSDPGPNTQILLYGEGLDSGIFEPLAWTNRYGRDGRAFYTSLGYPEDFKEENFQQMILNSISWVTSEK